MKLVFRNVLGINELMRKNFMRSRNLLVKNDLIYPHFLCRDHGGLGRILDPKWPNSDLDNSSRVAHNSTRDLFWSERERPPKGELG